jgi:hypothetical protein
VALNGLLDLEKAVPTWGATEAGLPMGIPAVGPQQVLGMEVNAYAHELAQVVIWIGYLQWMIGNGFGWREPMLRDLETIRLQDALITVNSTENDPDLPDPSPHRHSERSEESLREAHAAQPHDTVPVGEDLVSSRAAAPSPRELRADAESPDATGEGIRADTDAPDMTGEGIRADMESAPTNAAPRVVETEWPAADFIIGNPPFLDGNKIRQELGDRYVDTLFRLYDRRVRRFADLCCYFFEKARAQVADNRTKRAGLLATNSIRGGVNREVLKSIKDSGDIYMAWSDEPWILNGAAVRISIVGFDDGSESSRTLNGMTVAAINPDLTSADDITQAVRLTENLGIGFMGFSKKGPFDIDRSRRDGRTSGLSISAPVTNAVLPLSRICGLPVSPRAAIPPGQAGARTAARSAFESAHAIRTPVCPSPAWRTRSGREVHLCRRGRAFTGGSADLFVFGRRILERDILGGGHGDATDQYDGEADDEKCAAHGGPPDVSWR